MGLLIAADVLIQAERKRLDLDAWLRAHPDEEIRLAAITVADLWRSMERADDLHRARRQNFLERALEVFEIVPYTGQAAVEHARLSTVLEAAGLRISTHDLILAATAIASGDTIVTFNARRFATIKGLTVIMPQ